MVKRFITQRDIEDMATRGDFTLTLCDEIVLTNLAFEMAERLGVKLVKPQQIALTTPKRVMEPVTHIDQEDVLRQRLRSAVRTKLGDQISPDLLERIITRVLDNIGAS